tara:strand:- start:31 stop:396 length:366 start_codon:yes stop_codon:yes gene_type:complete
MNLFKGIISLKQLKKVIYLSTLFLVTNNSISFASDNKANLLFSGQIDKNFEEIYSLNSIPFDNYDNYENQIKTFFGFYSVKSERSYFQDLSLIKESKMIRSLYKDKLNEMTINKNNNIIKR